MMIVKRTMFVFMVNDMSNLYAETLFGERRCIKVKIK